MPPMSPCRYCGSPSVRFHDLRKVPVCNMCGRSQVPEHTRSGFWWKLGALIVSATILAAIVSAVHVLVSWSLHQ